MELHDQPCPGNLGDRRHRRTHHVGISPAGHVQPSRIRPLIPRRHRGQQQNPRLAFRGGHFQSRTTLATHERLIQPIVLRRTDDVDPFLGYGPAHQLIGRRLSPSQDPVGRQRGESNWQHGAPCCTTNDVAPCCLATATAARANGVASSSTTSASGRRRRKLASICSRIRVCRAPEVSSRSANQRRSGPARSTPWHSTRSIPGTNSRFS